MVVKLHRIKELALTLLLIFIFVHYSEAQFFKAEMIAGTNISQVDGDETYGFKKLGFNGGFGVIAPLGKNWSLSLETLYSQKGSRLRPQRVDSLDGSYKLKLGYAEVPFMIQYTDKDLATLGLGFSWNRLVSVDEMRNGYKIDSVSLTSKVFDKDDFMAFADMRLRVYNNIFANVRYSYSLNKISTRTLRDSETGRMNERDWYNNVWSVRLIYMINEQRPAKKAPAPKLGE
jgi:hypothetical protein